MDTKKVLVALLLVLAVIPTAASAADLTRNEKEQFFTDFTKADWCRQGIETALWVADWRQTIKIKDHPNLHETNIFLGEHPSDGQINAYMGGMIVSHALIAWALPQRAEVFGVGVNPRALWQYVFIATEGVTVGRNYRLGLRFSF